MIKFRKAIYLGIGATAIYFGARVKSELKKEDFLIQESINKNSKLPLLDLKSSERLFFPWERDFNQMTDPENWEMRKIKLRGVLFGHFHLVERERNGQKGYLVFKAMKTANSSGASISPDQQSNKISIKGMMINLGWLSFDNLSKLKSTELSFVSKVEPDTTGHPLFAQLRNPHTGFVYNAEGDDLEFPIEGLNEEEVIVTGFLRKAEQPSYLLARKYYDKEKVSTFIDLDRMSALYSFANVWSSRTYYLETAVEGNFNEVKSENIVIPSSLKNPSLAVSEYKDNSLYQKWAKMQKVAGVMTALLVTLV